MQSAGLTDAADESIDPSARKGRGPQDDKGVFRALVDAGSALPKSTFTTNSNQNTH